MKPNPIPLTLALAPFDRVETLGKTASRLDTLRASLDGMSKFRDDKEAAYAELQDKYPNMTFPAVVRPSQEEQDLQAEVDALQALHDLAAASTGDTIFLSTHAHSLLAE